MPNGTSHEYLEDTIEELNKKTLVMQKLCKEMARYNAKRKSPSSKTITRWLKEMEEAL